MKVFFVFVKPFLKKFIDIVWNALINSELDQNTVGMLNREVSTWLALLELRQKTVMSPVQVSARTTLERPDNTVIIMLHCFLLHAKDDVENWIA